ncbi:hypothetical protein C7379_10147 [Hallella colorans]|uniref:Uncharacterized protein n=1 Tax=Hallella colorans TaxID=1703337 RepID=A0A2U0UNQ4_9BACT|nr:hypothetical protein C7379_10147 [Hallella colorans]
MVFFAIVLFDDICSIKELSMIGLSECQLYSHPSPHTSSASKSKGLEWMPLASSSMRFPLGSMLLSLFIPR